MDKTLDLQCITTVERNQWVRGIKECYKLVCKKDFVPVKMPGLGF
jgi:hypothetical protein